MVQTGQKRAIFFVSVKNLSSGPRDHRQVPFNKRLEGYLTVPSASPFYLHALYSGATNPYTALMYYVDDATSF